jgi:hypothetical protein
MTTYTVVKTTNPPVDGVEVFMDIRTTIFRVENPDIDLASKEHSVSKEEWRDIADRMGVEALGFDGAFCGATLRKNSRGIWYLRTIEA